MTALLLACPQLCRAESLGCCSDHAEESGAPSNSEAPGSDQNEAVSCICAGAIRVFGSRLDSKSGLGDWPLALFPLASILPSSWNLPPLTLGGAPPERPRGGP